ncbi:Uncharacterised protein [[Clostridium] sordellii]|uniref:Uncharacterized protein n=1 Tax=Paraclostridium sordellii TaxID=1505 RepID=A0ABM9RN53_PARSO|nr:hypothetical protein [Paeniclostridium sordellii]EPZ57210.1 putative membrane protein [[Clostridium] sordellii ATCC 9714] [Paeniclostridium sordellii ATCC 9714]CEJ73473.1 hypothetical protein ATCC9714_13611 [[Clostridium] sordellii] [Paeniclostridium sordellii]CEN69024.1 Uncharacterised protein [[Clostridium] sordellii] [Paeniclostridium sordellii]CEN72291.1 Uncharacterised protein [[Clostridium] sordellii] [Paeniclostridium sordellii]CEO23584.1 Uncharacterised protein [[Clostridium] sordel
MKNISKFQFILIVIICLSIISDIYVGNLNNVFKNSIICLFLILVIIKDNLINKNKVVNFLYWTLGITSTIMIILNILNRF